ncbi:MULTISPECIES: HIT family protein [Priestia]|uniref:HIT family protein n=1 Tax=Priestia TaxID=2800373 RepID=UPI00372D862A
MPFPHEGHLLILPKKHIVEIDELDTERILAVMNAAKLMTKAVKTLFIPDGVTLSQNGGMFNELTHFHMHVVPRYKEECFGDFYTQIPKYAEKDDALAATAQKIRRVIQQMPS